MHQHDTPVPSYANAGVSSTALAVTALLHLLLLALFLFSSQKEEHALPPSGGAIAYITQLPDKPTLVEAPTPTAKPPKPIKERKQEVVQIERLPDTITMPDEKPVVREPAPPEAEPPKPAPPAPVDDMSQRIAARQAARALERAQSGEESEAGRANKVARANIESANGKTYGDDERETVYSLKVVSFNQALIRVNGWNEKFKRPLVAVAEVDLGYERDIETASIKGLISMLRSSGASAVIVTLRRLNKKVTFSLRPEDNDELEDILYKEHFPKYVRTPAK